MTAAIRVLLLADTHMGLDLALRPRVERRRRGLDFLANMRRALEPALNGEADIVVHGGDLLDRGRVPTAVVEMALEPLLEVARAGVPVFLVPGNHERSRIPLHLWTAHPNLHIFHQPGTFMIRVRDCRVALFGFPFDRQGRTTFAQRVAEAQHFETDADLRLLCVHQTVEGAQVGPGNYTFRTGADVVRGRDVPPGFAAVLSGHIHRRQVLTHDLGGLWPRLCSIPGWSSALPLPSATNPRATCGSSSTGIHRRGRGERREGKERVKQGGGKKPCQEHSLAEKARLCVPSVVILHLVSAVSAVGSEWTVRAEFRELPARPMVSLVLLTEGRSATALAREVRQRLETLPPDAVVRIALRGPPTPEALCVLSAARLREWAPPSMNVSVAGSVFQARISPQRHKDTKAARRSTVDG